MLYLVYFGKKLGDCFMALIDLQQISKQYDTKRILHEVDFTLLEGERIAIIGQNGTGKSTLMKIIMKLETPDSGEMAIDSKVKIEMLSQAPQFDASMNVKEAIEAQLWELKEAKERYDELSLRLCDEFDNKALMEEHAKLSTFLDFHNAWDLENRIYRVMVEFDLMIFEHSPVSMLSGGEQRRVALAGLILKKPDILLLDEPTNHLDVYMVEFLEQILLKENFTLIFISHDRYFIDNIATSTIEIENGSIRRFNGGYGQYLEQKEILLSNMQKEHDELLRLVKREEWWLAHGISARRKRNERRKSELFELRDKAKTNPSLIHKMKVELQREQKAFNSGEVMNKRKMLFEVEYISKKLGDKTLISDFSTRVLQKDKIAIVGANGTGKSTLLKMLLGDLKPDNGVIKMGDFKVGYFDQHRKLLDNDKDIMEIFCPFGGDRVELDDGRNMHIYGYLKNFLFPREYLDKKVGLLSGGEKNRVALALLFTKKLDIMILDEPTNDLDLPTINILEEYLQAFQGALIFVSHDRYFVDKIAQKLFIFKGDGVVEESYQAYSEYLEIEKELKSLDIMESDYTKNEPKLENKERVQTKLSYKEKRDFDTLPDILASLEAKIDKLNHDLMDVKVCEEVGINNLYKELKKTQEEYEELGMRYLELEEKVDSFSCL
jgi:ATP-binding cassette subfamily F protein uup